MSCSAILERDLGIGGAVRPSVTSRYHVKKSVRMITRYDAERDLLAIAKFLVSPFLPIPVSFKAVARGVP